MSLQPVPDDQKFSLNRRVGCFEEFDNLRTLDGAGEQSEIEAAIALAPAIAESCFQLKLHCNTSV